jgi:hypothetical protein
MPLMGDLQRKVGLMTKKKTGLKGFLWSLKYNMMIRNKTIPRERVIGEIKEGNGIGDSGAKWQYAWQVGVIDERGNRPFINSDGFIEVDEAAMKRRKKYMREGDIEWWYGDNATIVMR